MSLKKFRDRLLDQTLIFLWGEWSSLGVPGTLSRSKEIILDPEALLVFSLQLGRYEPRLFDEILNWLVENGHWLDAARLRRILPHHEPETARVVGAALQFCLTHSAERKWKNLARFCESIFKKQPLAEFTPVLFKEKSGKDYPLTLRGNSDPDFALFHLDRSKIKKLRESNSVPINTAGNIRFYLRSLFGVGGRAECILYLLTNEGGRVRDIAEGVGLFWLSVQQLLDDLIVSGLVSTRQKGKKTEYWLSHERWWSFLAYHNKTKVASPRWHNWIALYSGMLQAWRTIEDLVQKPVSDYMTISKLQDCVEHLSREFARGGLDVPPLSNEKNLEAQQAAVERLFEKVIWKKEDA